MTSEDNVPLTSDPLEDVLLVALVKSCVGYLINGYLLSQASKELTDVVRGYFESLVVQGEIAQAIVDYNEAVR